MRNHAIGTIKLRSQFHRQNTAVRASAGALNGFLATQTQALMLMRRESNRMASDQARARAIVENIQPFGIDDDPQLVFAQRILRGISHFRLEDMPLTQALVDLHAKHAFMIDAKAMASFCTILHHLRINDKDTVLHKLCGRVNQISKDFTVQECSLVLRAYPTDVAISQRLVSSAVEHAHDLNGDDLAELIVSARDLSHLAIEHHSDAIVAWIESPSFGINQVEIAARLLGACSEDAPRAAIASLLCVVQRNFLRELPTASCVGVLNMLRRTSFRHERMALRLASKVCQDQSSSSSHALSAARCLAHFYFANAEILEALSSFATPRDVTAMCECFQRLRLPPTVLFGRPLGEVCRNLAQLQVGSLSQICRAAIFLKPDAPKDTEANVLCVLEEIRRRGVIVDGVDLSVLSSNLLQGVRTS